MGEDEAGTAHSVREHREAARPIVAGLGRRIVKTMGDGLLLDFPSVVAAIHPVRRPDGLAVIESIVAVTYKSGRMPADIQRGNPGEIRG
jgi:class 3 adenylate cyclase